MNMNSLLLRRAVNKTAATTPATGRRIRRFSKSWNQRRQQQQQQQAQPARSNGTHSATCCTRGQKRPFHSSSPILLSSSPPSSSSSSTTKAFNRRIKTIQKSNTTHHIPSYTYVQREIASRLIDRLDDIVREDGFPLALDVGSGSGFLWREICMGDGYPSGGIGGVRKLVMLDSSEEVLHYNNDNDNNGDGDGDSMALTKEEKERCSTYKLVADEEQKLPFPDGTFDLVLSSTSMHWVNDLPGLWTEINRVLKPDGCFLFAMVGGMTLHELSFSLSAAELEREGGMSPHVGPFVNFSDVGSLLTGAGFNLTTVDVDTVKLAYPNAMVLMEHLQRMGENNACLNRRPFVGVDTFLAASCLYDRMYPLEGDGDGNDGDSDRGSVEATVQVIYGIGWVPHDSQPKPKERGSAKHKVGDIVVDETKSQK